MTRALRLLLLLLFALLPSALAAQAPEESLGARLDRWESEAKALERRLEFDPPQPEEVEGALSTLNDQLELVPPTRQRLEAQLAPLREQRAALGDPPEDPAAEAPQIASERQRLDGEIAALEANLKRLEQAAARARGLETRLAQLRRSRFTEELFSRGPSLFDLDLPARGFAAIQRVAGVIALEIGARIESLTLTPERTARLVLPLFLLVGGIAIGLKLRAYALRRLIAGVSPEMDLSRRVTCGAAITLVRLILPAWAVGMVLGGLLLTGLLGGRGETLLSGLAETALIVVGAYALGGAYYAPSAPTLRLSKLNDSQAMAALRWLAVLALVMGLDRVFVDRSDALGMAVEGLALINIGLLVVGGIALWRYARFLYSPAAKAEPEPAAPAELPLAEEDEEGEGGGGGGSGRWILLGAKLIARFAAVAAPVLAAAGYFAGSRYLFYPLVYSGALIGLCLLLFHIVNALVVGLASERGGTLDRLRLVPIFVGLVLASAAAPLLALIWGASAAELEVAWRRVLEGFTVGEVTISPVDFMIFLGLVVLGVILTARMKRLLKRNVLPLTGLDTGGRDAIAAGAGYLGIVVTVLIAVSATGVDLSSLAIVAGALSVGIGFGLQNIVNNFVSGIILLIERPIKAGDWIELPSGMGYVKTINVRSTEVETFDRSSLFVPNSQLISENVINWTHSNLHGRIIVKVGVDYGSDPRQVERVLLEIARAHPLMLRRPAPYVLFRGFGADSLEFEIRGILRDVNWVLNVQSDINFEIARRFREEGIGIPFRQADISIKNAEDIARALRGEVPGAQVPPAAPEPSPGRYHDEPARDPDGGPGADR